MTDILTAQWQHGLINSEQVHTTCIEPLMSYCVMIESSIKVIFHI